MSEREEHPNEAAAEMDGHDQAVERDPLLYDGGEQAQTTPEIKSTEGSPVVEPIPYSELGTELDEGDVEHSEEYEHVFAMSGYTIENGDLVKGESRLSEHANGDGGYFSAVAELAATGRGVWSYINDREHTVVFSQTADGTIDIAGYTREKKAEGLKEEPEKLPEEPLVEPEVVEEIPIPVAALEEESAKPAPIVMEAVESVEAAAVVETSTEEPLVLLGDSLTTIEAPIRESVVIQIERSPAIADSVPHIEAAPSAFTQFYELAKAEAEAQSQTTVESKGDASGAEDHNLKTPGQPEQTAPLIETAVAETTILEPLIEQPSSEDERSLEFLAPSQPAVESQPIPQAALAKNILEIGAAVTEPEPKTETQIELQPVVEAQAQVEPETKASAPIEVSRYDDEILEISPELFKARVVDEVESTETVINEQPRAASKESPKDVAKEAAEQAKLLVQSRAEAAFGINEDISLSFERGEGREQESGSDAGHDSGIVLASPERREISSYNKIGSAPETVPVSGPAAPDNGGTPERVPEQIPEQIVEQSVFTVANERSRQESGIRIVPQRRVESADETETGHIPAERTRVQERQVAAEILFQESGIRLMPKIRTKPEVLKINVSSVVPILDAVTVAIQQPAAKTVSTAA